MPRIMIFDDDQPSAQALRRNLLVKTKELSLDWDILIAARSDDDVDDAKFIQDGLNAIEAAQNESMPIDLVLTDLCMTDNESGYEVLDRAKEIDPSLMTILYTGRPGDLDRERAYKSNVYAIVNRTDQTTIFSNELFYLARAALHFRTVQRFADKDVAKAMGDNSDLTKMAPHHLTVAFWDIRGFSALTQDLVAHPDILAAFITDYCNLARNVVEKHNGLLDKFIGDGAMALFGHPLKGEPVANGAPAAIAAALEFNRRFNELVETKWMAKFCHYAEVKKPLLGCGLHTERVLVGYIGAKRGEFTAIGHGVNLAARVQDKAQNFPILITGTTKAWAAQGPDPSQFQYQVALENAEFKNIMNKLTLYSVQPR